MNPERLRLVRQGKETTGPVVYWMSRDQRARDNWALLFAQNTALQSRAPLVVAFCLVPTFLGATWRQYSFMLDGLREVEGRLRRKGIAFAVLYGDPVREIPRFAKKHRARAVVTDFDPIRIKREWTREAAAALQVKVYEVDAHNIVPCWVASGKQEFGAYTLRPKIKRLLPEFLDDFPGLKKHPVPWREDAGPVDWERAGRQLNVDKSVPTLTWVKSGEGAANRALRRFVATKLKSYERDRNNPTLDATSNLSPYIHFGQLSAQRVALEVVASEARTPAKEAFLEELIVRRELSDNFCFYNANYDKVGGFPGWAAATLGKHATDKREYVYSANELEHGKTHDPLWNAAQAQMVRTGKMHGYMRMYWAKKILEWSATPAGAMRVAVRLNDKYELDGRDPNGYAGIAWAIGGVHDRPWPERRVFGKIRYMSYEGCRRKFDVNAYVATNSGGLASGTEKGVM